MHAETAYLFRHALLRDAAYQVQLPGDRGKLHALAFEIIETLLGGRAPEPPSLDAIRPPEFEPHSTDQVAAELAAHARLALEGEILKGDSATAMLDARGLYLRRSAELADRHFETKKAPILWAELAQLLAGSARGEALRRAGEANRVAGQPEPAEQLICQALNIFRDTGNRNLEALALRNLATVLGENRRLEQAQLACEQALAFNLASGDRRAEGITLGTLANIHREAERLDLAEQTYERALAILRAVGEARVEGVALGNLASVLSDTGRYEKAERTYELALTILRKAGELRIEGVMLGNLGNVYRLTGRVAQSETLYEQALARHRETGNRRFEGMSLANLASVYSETGRLELSERTHYQALEIHREVGNRRSEGISLGNLANVHRATGRLESAMRGYEQALAIHREVGNRRFEGIHCTELAICLLDLKCLHDARETWRHGAAILGKMKDSELEYQTTSMHAACKRAGVPPFDEP